MASAALAVVPQQETFPTVQETLQNMRVVQQVMQNVMKSNVHYGVIPGCKQPSLYKAGSEALLSTFHIAVEPIVEEFLSHDGRGRVTEIRYRVKCIGKHIGTGREVGFGVGECSTGEDKYAWRRAVCPEEFDATDETLRRVRWSKYGGKPAEATQQVRVNPADVANTVLKMAKKRAQIDLTLTALGCSDIFAQDLEDIDENLRENLKGEPQPVPMDPVVLAGWLTAVATAGTEETLKQAWTDGLAATKESGDMKAYEALKAAVSKRRAELKPAAGQEQPQQETADHADDPVQAGQ